jgi:hypothetical protein
MSPFPPAQPSRRGPHHPPLLPLAATHPQAPAASCCLQSQKGAELIWKYPILLDACANEVQRQGDAMMSKWAEVRCTAERTTHAGPGVCPPGGTKQGLRP